MQNAQLKVEVPFLSCLVQVKLKSCKMCCIMYVPDIKRNFLSVAMNANRGLEVCFDKVGGVILDTKGKVVGKGICKNNLYELSAFIAKADVGTSRLWHERMGHELCCFERDAEDWDGERSTRSVGCM